MSSRNRSNKNNEICFHGIVSIVKSLNKSYCCKNGANHKYLLNIIKFNLLMTCHTAFQAILQKRKQNQS